VSNQETLFSEMYARLSGVSLSFFGCSVKKPAGCLAVITLEFLAATTQEQGMALKFSPMEGTKIGSVEFSGCTNEALNTAFPLTGSFTATPNGATLTTSEAGITGQKTLKIGGQIAGLETSLTLERAFGGALTFTT